MKLYQRVWLRRLIFPLFSRINLGTIVIKHPHTSDPLMLHSFRHKIYWFHGKNLEADEIKLMSELIIPGATVLDIGAHIGFLTILFLSLTGDSGQVFAFEPGADNLKYLEKNLVKFPNARIVPKAVSDQCAKATLYVDNYTGTTNTIVDDPSRFAQTSQYAATRETNIFSPIEIETTTLDMFIQIEDVSPSFIKIDVEGAEYQVLRGAQQLLHDHSPILFIELTANIDEVIQLLHKFEYTILNTDGTVMETQKLRSQNVICIPNKTFSCIQSKLAKGRS